MNSTIESMSVHVFLLADLGFVFVRIWYVLG